MNQDSAKITALRDLLTTVVANTKKGKTSVVEKQLVKRNLKNILGRNPTKEEIEFIRYD